MGNDLKDVLYADLINPEYKQLVESVYREQATILMQRALRKKRRMRGKTSSRAISDDVTKSNSLFKVIQEPTDEKYKEHAKNIKDQQYDLLRFDDPQFVRNIYKCLRLSEINLNQMHLALQLYQARDWLRKNKNNDYPAAGRLHRFRYDDPNGPYQALKEISYATETNIQQFYTQLKNPEDQTYHTINFTAYEEYYFFRAGLLTYKLLQNKKFQEMLAAYIKNKIGYFERDFAAKLLERKNPQAIQEYIDKRIGEKTIEHYHTQHQDSSFRDSASFLCAVLTAKEDNPTYQLSPDYKPSDKNSPTLCFVITSLTAENELQRAVHGEEIMLSALNAGRLTMRMIRALDERPGLSDKKEAQEVSEKKPSVSQVMSGLHSHQYKYLSHPARPVEMTHPDLIKTPFPHESIVSDFLLGWHDRFHAWRCGANFKAAIRHERALLSHRGVCQQKDFVMTHGIWLTLDKDLHLGKDIRNAEGDQLDKLSYDFFSNILFRARAIDDSRDLFLLNFIDMIKNPAVWDSFLPSKIDHETFRELITETEDFSTHPLTMAYNDSALIATIEKNKDKANESIILRCKLRSLPKADILCDIADEIGLEKLFVWTMNEGLQTTAALGVEKILLDNLHSPDQLARLLKDAIHKIGNDEQRALVDQPQPIEKFQWTENDIKPLDIPAEKLKKIAEETSDTKEIEAIARKSCCSDAVAIAILSNKKVFPSIKTINLFLERFYLNKRIVLLVRHHPCQRIRNDMASRIETLQIAHHCQDPEVLGEITKKRNNDDDIQMALAENKYTTENQLMELIEKNNVSVKFLITISERIPAHSFHLSHAIFSNKKLSHYIPTKLATAKKCYDNFISFRQEIIDTLNDTKTYPIPTSRLLGLFSNNKEALEKISDITSLLNQAWSQSEIQAILSKFLKDKGPDWYLNRLTLANETVTRNTVIVSQK